MQLEALPAELRRHLLFTLEYEALKTLVHASPVYHQQYLLDRFHILYKFLETALGSPSMVIDAYAVEKTNSVGWSEARTEMRVTHFLETYQSYYESPPDIHLKGIPFDEIVSMVAFHFSIIMPLVAHYSGRELSCLTKSPSPLSNTEETRLVRGLYRFQLYCNLFGVGPCKSDAERFKFVPKDIMRLFFNMFEPWEVEEIVCTHHYVRWKVERVFKRISLDVYRNSKFDIRGNDVLIEGTTSRGPEILHTTLFKTKDHTHLVSTMQEQISPPRGYSIEHV